MFTSLYSMGTYLSCRIIKQLMCKRSTLNFHRFGYELQRQNITKMSGLPSRNFKMEKMSPRIGNFCPQS